MYLLFDPCFDATNWPGPLTGTDATFGSVTVGPLHLLNILETALGLGGPPVGQALRAASLITAVRSTDGFWAHSAEIDPLGAARRLLGWRDELRMAGWRGEPVSARLAALAAVTAGVVPGIPDRLETIVATLVRRSAEISAVELLAPQDDTPRLWRRVFAMLEAHGTCVTTLELEPAGANGDLAAARMAGFVPVGDRTLQLLRSHGPLQAAEEVAAWLAGSGKIDDTVVIGGDAMLDAALRRHGLPTTGSGAGGHESALLQILPLVLALGWRPPDPGRALELLTLPTSPVPRRIAGGLVRALHEWPAVGSDTWRTALTGGIAKLETPEERDRVRLRLATMLTSVVPRGEAYPATEIRRRLDALDAWIRGRLLTAATAEEPAWRAAALQCAVLRQLVDSSGLPSLPGAQLQRFLEDASEAARVASLFPAEAGLAAVRSPDAVAGPARRIVWWAFTRDTVPAPVTVPLTRAERTGLADVGVEIVDPGRAAVAMATRWRRPLLQATSQLLLVCPLTTANGEEQHPHPLWDELAARLAPGAGLTPLVRTVPDAVPPKRVRTLAPLPAPRRVWAMPAGSIRFREKESPSSLAAMLGCAFQWAVRYQGHVHEGTTATLPAADQLLGKVTHELLAQLLKGGVVGPDEAETRAQALFDIDGPRLAAPLFLPGADAARGEARQVLGLAARVLCLVLAEGGFTVHAVESDAERAVVEGTLTGRPDLVLGPRRAVIDLKWSGSAYRRSELAAGTAHQLAAYSYLLGEPEEADFPPVGFFILRDQRLLTTNDQGVFPGAERVDGADPAASWRALAAAHEAAHHGLTAGRLEASGNRGTDGTPVREASEVDAEGVLRLTAPCQFCAFDVLCGRAFAR